MLLRPSSPPPAQSEPAIQWRSRGHHTIGWIGNIFLPGNKAGVPTIDHVLEQLEHRPAAELLPALNGVYGLFIYDQAAQKWLVATDNAGLYRIFYSAEAVSTRFLELAMATPASRRPFDDQSIVEFITIGGNYGRHTPISTINKLRRGEILELQAAASPAIRVVEKPLEKQPADAERYVLQYFTDFAHAVADKNVSVDLTGGFDSRVTACLLSRAGLPFDCDLIGKDGTGEVVIAQAVAEVLGRTLHLHKHDIAALEHELYQTWLDGDGLTEMPGLHRDRQLCLRRLGRGCELMVHSGCGEFFSDRFYIQDFPRYGSHRSDVAKFYRLRIAPIPMLDQQLTEEGLALYRQVSVQTIATFEKARQATNNQTYDSIFYEYKAPEYFGSAYSNYLNMGMKVEAPFLNFRMVMTAMNLPPWSRIFLLWNRRIISAHCPELAEIRTFPGGFTASDRTSRLLAETGTYVLVQASRVGRKLTERYLGKALFRRAADLAIEVTGYRDGLRRSALAAAAVGRLQQQGILGPNFDIEQAANVHVGRIMTMGTLLDHLDRS